MVLYAPTGQRKPGCRLGYTGWTFGYQHSFWDKESLKALLSNVPDDKMIIIDLGNDIRNGVEDRAKHGKYMMGFTERNGYSDYVPNFGGKNTMTGDLDMYASSSVKALRAANKGNLIGFGSAPEGLENNEVVYELLADMDGHQIVSTWTIG
mgnify:CR=1 FL=1